MKKTLIIVFLLALALLAWASTPKWLNNPEDAYPARAYLTATGDGDTEADAQAMAMLNLAKIFETKVKATQEFREQYYEITKQNDAQTGSTTSHDTNVWMGVEETLSNVHFTGSYFDANTARVKVLAYMDRAETATIYIDKINVNNTKTGHFMRKGIMGETAIKRYAFYTAANMYSQLAQKLIDQLKIISPRHAQEVKLKYKRTEVFDAYTNAASRVTFSINLQHDETGVITDYLSDKLTGRGFIESEKAELFIVGSLIIKPIQFRDDLKTVKWKFTVKATTPTGDALVTYTKSDRESARTTERATARSHREIKKLVRKHVLKKINAYFSQFIDGE